jgi:hypothetical protein
MKGAGARAMVLLSIQNDVLVDKSAGNPKFALSEYACCPV